MSKNVITIILLAGFMVYQWAAKPIEALRAIFITQGGRGR